MITTEGSKTYIVQTMSGHMIERETPQEALDLFSKCGCKLYCVEVKAHSTTAMEILSI